jgi:hypothetical protein
MHAVDIADIIVIYFFRKIDKNLWIWRKYSILEAGTDVIQGGA